MVCFNTLQRLLQIDVFYPRNFLGIPRNPHEQMDGSTQTLIWTAIQKPGAEISVWIFCVRVLSPFSFGYTC